MLYNTEAVVVKTVRYGETHAIITLLTPTGKVAAMARGAMKPQSRLAAGVRLCGQGVYSIYQGKGMGNIEQVEMISSRRRLHEDLESAAYAAYFCELVLATVPDRPDADPALYRQFVALLDGLEQRTKSPAILSRLWEAKICRWLGVSPEWMFCVRCGEALSHSIRYHTQEGGFICPNCMLPEDLRMSYPVSEKVPKILYLFERTSITQLGSINISIPTMHTLQQTLYYQLTEFAGLYLKSREILNQLSETFGTEEGSH